MLLKPEPLSNAICSSKNRLAHLEPKVIFLTPQGEVLKHSIVEELGKEKALILLCGHYKGIDYRIREKYVDREVSIGDYILSGGEIAAMVIVDTISRLIPDVLGNRDSAERDSFFNGLLSPPQYTRPDVFESMHVPEVLLSGHHEKIRQWQIEQAKNITKKHRQDLWQLYCKKKENRN